MNGYVLLTEIRWRHDHEIDEGRDFMVLRRMK